MTINNISNGMYQAQIQLNQNIQNAQNIQSVQNVQNVAPVSSSTNSHELCDVPMQSNPVEQTPIVTSYGSNSNNIEVQEVRLERLVDIRV